MRGIWKVFVRQPKRTRGAPAITKRERDEVTKLREVCTQASYYAIRRYTEMLDDDRRDNPDSNYQHSSIELLDLITHHENKLEYMEGGGNPNEF